MTDGIHHITGVTLDEWGYSTMPDDQLFKSVKALIERIAIEDASIN